MKADVGEDQRTVDSAEDVLAGTSARQIVESLPLLAWTCRPDGRCDYLSRQWLEYTGATLASHVDYGWLDVVHPDDRAPLNASWMRSVETGMPLHVEFRIRRHDGEYRWFDTRAAPVRGPDGTVQKWFGFNNDVEDKKRAILALRSSEHRFRTVLENMTEGIVFVGSGGEVQYLNPVARQIMGLEGIELPVSRASLLPGYEHFHPDGMKLAPSEAPTARLFRGEEVRNMEVRMRRLADGVERIVSFSGNRITDASGEPTVFVTMSDVTEQAESRIALEESEERLRLANEAAGIGTYALDMRTGKMRVSSEIAAQLGYAGPEHIDMNNMLQFLHPEDRTALLQRAATERAAGGTGDLREQVRVIRSDGELRWVAFSNRTILQEVDGKRVPVRQVGASFDVTDLRRAERRLATQNAVSRVLADATTISEATQKLMKALCESEGWEIGSLWQVDSAAQVLRCAEIWHSPGAVLEAMAAAMRSTILRKGEGTSGRVWETGKALFMDIDPARVIKGASLVERAEIRKAMAFPVLVGSEVTGVITLSGHHGPAAEAKLLDMFEGMGRQLGVFFERKRAERDRQKLEAELHHAQKLEALGQLSSGIAHDFNNILTAIVGNVHLAREAGDLQETQECLEEIEKAASRASSLVRKVLTFARKQPQDRKAISLRPVIEECVGLLRASIPAGVQLHVTIDKEVPTVLADATAMHQLLVNLSTNAWHALPDNAGRVAIHASAAAVDRALANALSLPSAGQYCRLAVTDTGVGMDAKTQARIFEPFFTTKEAGRGTGLGLSVVYGIVRSHEGAIRVTSEPGKGTTFEVFLPAMGGPADRTSGPPASEYRGGGQSIMYIDDEVALTELVSRALRRRGFVPLTFNGPEQAISELERNPRQADIVVTDMNMPVYSGLQVAEKLLGIRPDLAVILVSGNVSDDLQRRADHMGIRKVLSKPVAIGELVAAIAELLPGK